MHAHIHNQNIYISYIIKVLYIYQYETYGQRETHGVCVRLWRLPARMVIFCSLGDQGSCEIYVCICGAMVCFVDERASLRGLDAAARIECLSLSETCLTRRPWPFLLYIFFLKHRNSHDI